MTPIQTCHENQGFFFPDFNASEHEQASTVATGRVRSGVRGRDDERDGGELGNCGTSKNITSGMI